ncbi:glycoside hydrolase family 6 protein [Nonomuraea sp. NPDC050663]|uniref:glycoside hydrolase family 6 protein n=1 Tax=Nonomuraea sp. NPDC050663 TaxID=3364370 RepID=UPI00379E5D73
MRMLIVVLLIVLAGCSRAPDTTLKPWPPQVAYAPLRQPFKDAELHRDTDSAAMRYRLANGAAWLAPITGRPQARWINGPADLEPLRAVAAQARLQGTLPVLVAYYLPNRGCAKDQGARNERAYQRYIGRLIRLLGATDAAVIMEPDAVPADCFTRERGALIAASVRRLAEAGHHVYIDAGHSAWRTTGETAERLLASGIQHAEGFAVNVSNRQSTDASYRWGRELSSLVGGREFVIDTSRNGLGPPPKNEWCNPGRQALGQEPTTQVVAPGLAALLWIKRPGESDGICGGEKTYLFSPRQARLLIDNAQSSGVR